MAVQLAASQLDKPKWFVSHWWGELLHEFLSCLRQHARDRGIEPSDPGAYWICAMAVNQWVLSSVTTDLQGGQSVFAGAIKAARGVLSIIDPHGRSCMRSWCTYEVCLALDIAYRKVHTDNDEEITKRLADPEGLGDHFYKLDVYSIDPLRRTVCGITDGLTTRDRGSEATRGQRVRAFPLSVLKEIFRVRVQDGMTTVPYDRDRILNALIAASRGHDALADPSHAMADGADALDADAPANHDTYWYLNKLFYSRVLPMSFDAAMSGGSEEQRRWFKALNFSGIDELAYSFVYDEDIPAPHATNKVLKEFFSSLPDTIAHLKLVLPTPQMPAQLPSCKHLYRVRVLNLSDSKTLEALPEWLGELPQLKHLHLSRCIRLKHLPRSLPKIYSKFKDIIINLLGCASLFAMANTSAGRNGRNTPFNDIEQLAVVREILAAAEQTACEDLLTVLDAHGERIETSKCCGLNQ